MTQKLNVGGAGVRSFRCENRDIWKKVGGGAPIHTPDEIHHGKRCIHVTLDNKVILFLLKCILIHLYAKRKSVLSAMFCPCPVRNAQLITPLSHS